MEVKVFRVHPDAVIPQRAEDGAAGYDLRAIEDFTIHHGEKVIVRTGLVIQPPEGYHTEILPRSGLAFKHNIMLANNVGLVDRSFSGPDDEIKVMLYMAPEEEYDDYSIEVPFKKHDRIAQIVFRKTEVFDLVEVNSAPKESSRSGFGSTGLR